MVDPIPLPQTYQQDVNRAVEILRQAGCTHIFLFGSLTAGKVKDGSDIDLAVRGCPKGRFFQVLGTLLMEVNHPVDLVDLDKPDPFARYLEEKGELVQIG
jgi:predicted nucleotidyltransferase